MAKKIAAGSPPSGRKAKTATAAEKSIASSATKSGVVVIGSLNMDLVFRTETMPQAGETVMGQDLLQNPGGKGANQATAVARLWGHKGVGARLIGRIGEDDFGEGILRALEKSKVETGAILKTRGVATGTAMVLLDRLGENAIVVAPGANRHLSATDLLAQRKSIEAASVLAAQLEIPHDTVACAFALAKRCGVLTILDPAPMPADGLLESLYHVDILTPNQSEAQALVGFPVRNVEDARRAADRLLTRGAGRIVFKMSSQGAVIAERNAKNETVATHVTGFRVPVTDTTAAGDAFTGALAVALAENVPLLKAVKFANAAGAIACMKPGAITSMPTRAEVDQFLLERA